MAPLKAVEMWEINTKAGWLVRPEFINKAIDEGLIEIVEDRWIVYGINATTIAKDGDCVILYKNDKDDAGIAIYSKAFITAAKEILNIINVEG